MKVCQYIPHGAIPDIRGFAPAIVAQQFYKNFSKDIEHYFVCNQEEYLDSKVEDEEFGEIFRIKEGKVYKRLFQKITKLDPYPLYKKLANIINKNDIDVLHVHQLEFPINDFKKLIRNKKIKIIVHVHALRNFDEKMGIANKYLAVSNYTKNMLIADMKYPANIIDVVYNGVDTQLFKIKNSNEVSIIKKDYKIGDGLAVISYIGRKQESKGFYVFLKTVESLFKNNYKVFAISVGPTPQDTIKDKFYKEETELLNKLKENKYFLDLPPLTHDKLSLIYKMTDIVLFQTYFKGEQHPLVALESISSNTILVSSKMFSLSEIIEDNKSGFLLENPKDEKAVIKKVEDIINNLEDYNYIRENASKIAIEKFDWKISTSKLEKIYHEVIGEEN